jgi:hypothetical protein
MSDSKEEKPKSRWRNVPKAVTKWIEKKPKKLNAKKRAFDPYGLKEGAKDER